MFIYYHDVHIRIVDTSSLYVNLFSYTTFNNNYKIIMDPTNYIDVTMSV